MTETWKPLSATPDYISFRSTVTQRKLVVDEEEDRVWTLFDSGPRSVTSPIICLPPCSGTADIYYQQLLALSAKGYRVISLNYPVVWNLRDFCASLSRLLDAMQLDRVHLVGASLGGFLAQKFAEETANVQRVASLFLINSFTETSIFRQTGTARSFWLMPATVLRNTVMHRFPRYPSDQRIAQSVEFLNEKLLSLSQPELASRLTLNCLDSYVEPQSLNQLPVTLVDVFDENALTTRVRENTYKCYPDARRAHMKTGGNFPYLSRADEVNLYLQIHLKSFFGTRYCPVELSKEASQLLQQQDDCCGEMAASLTASSSAVPCE